MQRLQNQMVGGGIPQDGDATGQLLRSTVDRQSMNHRIGRESVLVARQASISRACDVTVNPVSRLAFERPV
jgi:hypothetical protein